MGMFDAVCAGLQAHMAAAKIHHFGLLSQQHQQKLLQQLVC